MSASTYEIPIFVEYSVERLCRLLDKCFLTVDEYLVPPAPEKKEECTKKWQELGGNKETPLSMLTKLFALVAKVARFARDYARPAKEEASKVGDVFAVLSPEEIETMARYEAKMERIALWSMSVEGAGI